MKNQSSKKHPVANKRSTGNKRRTIRQRPVEAPEVHHQSLNKEQLAEYVKQMPPAKMKQLNRILNSPRARQTRAEQAGLPPAASR